MVCDCVIRRRLGLENHHREDVEKGENFRFEDAYSDPRSNRPNQHCLEFVCLFPMS